MFLLLCQIEQMRRHRWSAISFNRSWLEDIYEETICELPGERITPLVSNPGRVMLTSARLYFQPYNNVEVVCHRPLVHSELCKSLSLPLSPSQTHMQAPVLKVKLSDLKFVMKRRYMLRHMVCPPPPLTNYTIPPPPSPLLFRAWSCFVPMAQRYSSCSTQSKSVI